jgi:hypothetical protein
MSLLRLLTAGKSLVGMQPVAGRYKLSDPRAMPKFGAGKNPFKSKPEKILVAPSAEAPPAGGVAAVKTAEIEPMFATDSATVDDSERVSEPGRAAQASAGSVMGASALPANPVSARSESGGTSRRGRALREWFSKAKFLKAIWSRPSQGREQLHAGDSRPVQGELSLDNIKVMRNDLSDSDLEVIPLRSGPPAPDGRRQDEQAGAAASDPNENLKLLGTGRT